jgi:hypothetical protein
VVIVVAQARAWLWASASMQFTGLSSVLGVQRGRGWEARYFRTTSIAHSRDTAAPL